ncbi:FMN-binding protein [Thioclava electrotropha]|uniref:FMN-binding protein n=1 Tax=Thioclava electrotropha TaxID=1549850 RepID=A0ABX6YR36_9RHOB|nr:FMN-binding protein [Thioclava electrotropha]QPZ90143.1 FMN-binding protein [Thioclava electrotropha]
MTSRKFTSALSGTVLAVLLSSTAASAGFFSSFSPPRQIPANAQFQDGTWTGSPVRQYYGYVQVQAHVKNGKIASIDILRSPTDRRTSRYINSKALPMLEREIVMAQNTNVSYISGATLTSQAFLNSANDALLKSLK